ncbi:MAG: recombinase family protein [Planctomycetia bacterium]|nr:recombinase family protein [Planctomycetia bacterium]
MLHHAFDPSKPYKFVQYGRMSSDKQNPRSPDQQFDSISGVIRRQGHRWVHLRDYRDDARSGRYMMKRPGLQTMLRDLRTGMVQPDLILVDTLERLGRNDEIPTLRQELYHKHGILVLTADSGFADPLSVPGRALGFVESIRSTEDGRVKAHNVLRGKKDLILHKKAWPGGPVPLGFRLQSVMKTAASGNTEVDYNRLVRDPASDWIAERLFRQTDELGWGTTRLARHCNDDPAIPESFKPFSPWTAGYILDNPLYKGELRWNEHATGIINDTRVLQANPQEEWLRVPDFCDSIVPVELWDRVQALRQQRRQQIIAGRQRQDNTDGKQIAPPAPGLALKYLLSGLVRCGHCGASMRPSPSKFTNQNTGKVWRRTYYVCPSYIARTCPNGHYLPEDALRETVVARIRARLFPPPPLGRQLPDWFPGLVEQVQQELQRQAQQQPDERAAWEQEKKDLEERVAGWSLSLANPRLDASLRADIENQYGQTKARLAQLQQLLADQAGKEGYMCRMLDPDLVVDRLRRLGEVLAGNNPTQGNIELSRHVERIACFADGQVVLRSTPLGIFDGGVQWLRRPQGGSGATAAVKGVSGPVAQVQPRRRAPLRVEEPAAGDDHGDSAVDIADPARFAGLDACWFWEEPLELPRSLSWAEAHAAEVARLRTTLTMEQLAAHFGKTIPTIRNALRKAAASGVPVPDLPRKQPRACWAEEHAAEIAALKREGKSTLEIAEHFGKSATTIRAALQRAYSPGGVAG